MPDTGQTKIYFFYSFNPWLNIDATANTCHACIEIDEAASTRLHVQIKLQYDADIKVTYVVLVQERFNAFE